MQGRAVVAMETSLLVLSACWVCALSVCYAIPLRCGAVHAQDVLRVSTLLSMVPPSMVVLQKLLEYESVPTSDLYGTNPNI
jgi:hypothetical protein